VEGLIHISELSHDKVDKVESVLKPGDQVTVKIIGIDTEKRKISLSLRSLLEEPVKEVEPDQTVYEDKAGQTIGDLFGDLFDQK
jgi:4-hydroxy-3-methylbut-2-enyl diphosphate reductase